MLYFYILLLNILLFISCSKKSENDSQNNFINDIDGNSYKTIQIGNQVWMAENLKTTRYSNGDVINNISDSLSWQNLANGAWSFYDNNQNECGKLYNWYAIIDSRKICPSGWHIPSIEEFNELADQIGGSNLAGGKLKSVGTIQAGTGKWQSPNTNATDEYGFSGNPCGARRGNGEFHAKDYTLFLWTSTEYDSQEASYRFLNYNMEGLQAFWINKKNGFCARCIKD